MSFDQAVNDVMVAPNGGLLLTGGAHSVLKLFSGEQPPTPESADIFWKNHAERQAYCDKRQATYSYTVFPDKLVAYRDILGDERIGSVYARTYKRDDASSSLYLQVGVDDYRLTDTHFSAKGMISSTAQIVTQLGIDPTGFIDDYTSHLVDEPEYIGDLGKKLSPPVSETAQVIKGANRGERTTNGMVGGNDGIIDLLHNKNAMTDKTALIFGDSFFRQILVPLSYFFQNIMCVRTRYFHYECIDAVRPDFILAGCAERYLSRVYPDDVRPHFLSYALNSGRATNPSASFTALWNSLVDVRTLANFTDEE